MGHHDKLFREVFQDPSASRWLLAGVVSAIGAETPLRARDAARVVGAVERRADLAWVIDGSVEVEVLLEHQSQQDRTMDARCAALSAQRVLSAVTSRQTVPFVQVVVVWQGPGPWTASRDVGDRVEVADLDSRYLLRQRYHVVELEVLDGRGDGPAGARVAVGLLVAAQRPEGRPVRRLVELAGLVAVALEAGGSELARRWIDYLSNVVQEEPSEAEIEALAGLGPEMKGASMTWKEIVEQRAKAQGRQEGRDEGELRALREVLWSLGTVRWGAPTSEDRARIEAAGRDELTVWVGRLLLASEWSGLWAAD